MIAGAPSPSHPHEMWPLLRCYDELHVQRAELVLMDYTDYEHQPAVTTGYKNETKSERICEQFEAGWESTPNMCLKCSRELNYMNGMCP